MDLSIDRLSSFPSVCSSNFIYLLMDLLKIFCLFISLQMTQTNLAELNFLSHGRWGRETWVIFFLVIRGVWFHEPTFQHQHHSGLSWSVHNQETIFSLFARVESGLSTLPVATCWWVCFFFSSWDIWKWLLSPSHHHSLGQGRELRGDVGPWQPSGRGHPAQLHQHLQRSRLLLFLLFLGPCRRHVQPEYRGEPAAARLQVTAVRELMSGWGGRSFTWLGTVISIYSWLASSGASSPRNAHEMQMFSLESMKTLESAL